MIGNISKSKGFKGDKGDSFTYDDLTEEQKAELLGGAKFADKEELESHKNNANNPHLVTKGQIGLGNVDNTSDKDKPISDAVKEELGNKVDKVEGKGLSTNDFTDQYKNQIEENAFNVGLVSGVVDENSYRIGNLDNLNTDTTANLVDAINEIYDGKVDKVENYGLIHIDDHIDGYYTVPGAYDVKFVGVDTTAGSETITICERYCIQQMINPTPITETEITLERNKQYNFGEVATLNLAFPTVANDGDVIYLTFKSGAVATALTIDTTNTSDIEVIPEANTGYEIFGKYNGEIWIVNYSEYTVSEG